MRDYWRGADSMLSEFAQRFTGSSDLYKEGYRKPTASINFITAHDGFTLHDLVSYNEKHNEANGENNNDGESHNRSWNCGAEGSTDDQNIIALRNKQKRNFLTTLFFSQGVPMLVAGDELGKTQNGNNNAYCQDNEISWINWQDADKDLLGFVQKLTHFQHVHPVFCRRRWFKGRPIQGSGVEDIAWFLPNGSSMNEENWKEDFAKSLAVFLNGKVLKTDGPKGEHLVDNNFYIIFNAYDGELPYVLPSEEFGSTWIKVIDTNENFFEEEGGQNFAPGETITVHGRSVVVLKEPFES
jgi:glycogen operon protein